MTPVIARSGRIGSLPLFRGAPRPADAAASTSATPQGLFSLPPTGITVSWQLYTPPGGLYFADRTGTITVNGKGFTAGSTVQVSLDTPSGVYQQTVTAAEPSLFCAGPFMCNPPFRAGTSRSPSRTSGAGNAPPTVISGPDSFILAIDQQNGANTEYASADLATPCPQLTVP